MFGSEMKASTFFISLIEIITLIYALYQFKQASNKSFTRAQNRFVVLTLLFLVYNSCSGLFPDPNISIPLLVQNCCAFGSGILLACYYFYYLSQEFNIQKRRFFNTKLLVTTLVGSFLIGYVVVYGVTQNAALAKKSFILFPVTVSIYFCYKTVVFLFHSKLNQFTNNHSPYFKLKLTGYTGILFMASMPIVVFFGDYQVVNNTLVNGSFFCFLLCFLSIVKVPPRNKNYLYRKSYFRNLDKKRKRNCTLTIKTS